MDAIADLAPPLDRPVQPMTLRRLDRAIDRHPGHDLRVRELLAATAHFPDPLIGLLPRIADVVRELALHRPRGRRLRETMIARLVQGVRDFAVDVELPLRRRGIADAHGLRTFITWQPFHLPLVEPALAREAVHDLRL